MQTQLRLISALFLATLAFGACADEPLPRSAATDGARVYIIAPQDGEVVAATFKVKFGLSGMGVAPAGMQRANTGHHHLLVDVDELPDLDKPLPATEKIIHFGGGQTETVITLPPGEHTLMLVLGDHLHIPHDPALVSEKIIVRVMPPTAAQNSQ